MKKVSRARVRAMFDQSTFRKNLLRWYRTHARDLPWRKSRDPYRIWISEIMLQQTTVKAVIPYYHDWIKSYPDIIHVAQAPVDKILRSWQGLGYYQRARNIHRAAEVICRDFKGCLPREEAVLRGLPGFGAYTAGAVLSIAFNQRVPVIDANVRRVFMRIFLIEGKTSPKHDARFLRELRLLLPRISPGTFNQALMELGALVCRSALPLCVRCPVRSLCRAYKEGKQEIIPEPRSKPLKDIYAAVGILRKGKRYLIQQRPAQGLLAGLWEFPGGQLEEGETAREALTRELREELGVEVSSAEHFLNVKHYYTSFRVHLSVWLCEAAPYLDETPTRRWVTVEQMQDFPMPSGSVKIMDRIEILSKRSKNIKERP